MGIWGWLTSSKAERQARYEKRRREIIEQRDHRLSQWEERGQQVLADRVEAAVKLADVKTRLNAWIEEQKAKVDARGIKGIEEFHDSHAHCAQCGRCLMFVRGGWHPIPGPMPGGRPPVFEVGSHEHLPFVDSEE